MQSLRPGGNRKTQVEGGCVLVCDAVSTAGPPVTQSAGVEREEERCSQLLLDKQVMQSARGTLQQHSQLEAKGGAMQSAPPSPLLGSGNTAMSLIC